MLHSGMVLAAPQSGSGKTTITCALLAATKNRKFAVRAFKSGPDYIDPMFHRHHILYDPPDVQLRPLPPDEGHRAFHDDQGALHACRTCLILPESITDSRGAYQEP